MTRITTKSYYSGLEYKNWQTVMRSYEYDDFDECQDWLATNIRNRYCVLTDRLVVFEDPKEAAIFKLIFG